MKNIKYFIGDLLAKSGDSPDQLLQHLCKIQSHYSHIPEEALQLLADRLHIPPAQIISVVYFYSFLHMKARGEYDIRFSDNITDRMLGNLPLLESLCKKLGVKPGVPRADGRVTVALTSCTGICDQGPALLVNGMAISRLNEERIHKIVGLIQAGIPIMNWPKSFFVVEDNIQRQDKLLSHGIMSGSAIGSLAVKGGDAMLDWLDSSGLRGRGGAGFKTATKWRMCRETPADEHYVVCNADEGEPGTFKDRILLNSYAKCVFEGMTLCAGIISAKKGFLYLRGEYLYMRETLEKELQKRRDANCLGENILGKQGFDFDIEIHMGAGCLYLR